MPIFRDTADLGFVFWFVSILISTLLIKHVVYAVIVDTLLIYEDVDITTNAVYYLFLFLKPLYCAHQIPWQVSCVTSG
jgi:hypothetical protein